MNLAIAGSRLNAAERVKRRLIARLDQFEVPTQRDQIVLAKATNAYGKWSAWIQALSGPKKIAMKTTRFCGRCLGKAKRICPLCGKCAVVDLLERQRLDYLLKTWYKLKKYNMNTSGCPILDQQIKTEFGPWWVIKEPYV